MRVSAEELARIRRKVGAIGQRYGSTGLDGAVVDCDHALESGGFSVARVTKTGDLERMVIYRRRPRWEPHTTGEVAARLEECWLAHGAFTHEAHAISATPGEVTCDFVTWWDRDAFYTGRIEVAVPASFLDAP